MPQPLAAKSKRQHHELASSSSPSPTAYIPVLAWVQADVEDGRRVDVAEFDAVASCGAYTGHS